MIIYVFDSAYGTQAACVEGATSYRRVETRRYKTGRADGTREASYRIPAPLVKTRRYKTGSPMALASHFSKKIDRFAVSFK